MFSGYIKNNIVVQHDGDSGDSCQRTATYVFLSKIIENHVDANMLLEIQSSPGRFRRSNDPKHWGFRPSNCSRDQVSIARIALKSVGMMSFFKKSYINQAFRLGFHQNFLKGTDDIDEKWKVPDILSPGEVAILIRGLNLWILWPVLIVLDLLRTLDIIFRDKNNWDQDNMLAQHLYFSVKYMSTPVSVLNMIFYFKTNYMERIKNYYSLENNGIPPMIDLFQQAEAKIKELIWQKYSFLRFLLR